MSALAPMPDGAASYPHAPSARPFALTATDKRAPEDTGRRSASTASSALPAQAGTQRFADRILLLIERSGSVAALARRCGVTERTVRHWRSGHGDLSRERCAALAHALGISPLWLISGEGAMTSAPEHPLSPAVAPGHGAGVDSERLAAALQVLQSYVMLAGGSLSLAQRADAAAELYGLLAQQGPGDIGRLINFHKTLAAYLRSNRQALVT